MSDRTSGLAAIQAALAGGTQAPAINASDVRAALDEAREEGRQAGLEAGRVTMQLERARISGIMSCDEAKGRETLAEHFAFNTSLSLDDAKAALSKAPQANNNSNSVFLSRMNSEPNPKIGSDTSNNGGEVIKSTLDDPDLATRSVKRLNGAQIQ
jgi:hypothetical protein